MTLLFATALVSGFSEEKTIRVFVALCDNASQGIVPVGEKIGDGDKPDANLYWGCYDGFGSYFSRSKKWTVISKESDISEQILRRIKLRHVHDDIMLTGEAYRGRNIRECLADFEKAAASGKDDLVAFIGHNGLMEFSLPEPRERGEDRTDVVVLACVSHAFFAERLERAHCRPILMTQQLMYPGAFLLHDAIEAWRDGGDLDSIRLAAGKAYARNQKISVSAATGVFADLSP